MTGIPDAKPAAEAIAPKMRYDHLHPKDITAAHAEIKSWLGNAPAREDALLLNRIQHSVQKIADAAANHTASIDSLKTAAFMDAVDELNGIITASSFTGTVPFTKNIWFILHDTLLMRMYVKAAYQCRKNAVACMKEEFPGGLDRLDPAKISEWDFINYAGYVMEENKPDDYQALLAIYKKMAPEAARVARPTLRALNLIFDGRQKYVRDSAVTIKTNDDAAYASYLKGKSIAVVCPVNNHLASGAEIDKYDIVIRFNHHDAAIYDAKDFGQRTDISYYTNPAFKKLVLAKDGTLPDLAYAVPQNVLDLDLANKKTPLACRIRSQYRSSNRIFFKSHGNAVQRMMLDLMRFDVGTVKLFNMNMWLTPHTADYAARRKALDPHTFIHHDMVTNFCFLKTAMTHKLVETDKVLNDILSMSTDEYIDELHRRYAPA